VPNLSVAYSPAHTAPFLSGEDIVVPAYKALKKLYDKSLIMPKDLTYLFPFVTALAHVYKPEVVDLNVKSWSYVVQHNVLPSVDRAAACGLPFSYIGPTKQVGFVLGETVELTSDMIKLLTIAEEKLCPADWIARDSDDFEGIDSLNTFALKDEPRLKVKVLEGVTRGYQVTNLMEFLLQRKWFIEIVEFFTVTNLKSGSAMGLDPNDFDAFRPVLEGATGILDADFQFMDGSFTPQVFLNIATFVITWYGNEGPTREVYPGIRVDRNNFMRWSLLCRLMFHKVVIADEEFLPGVSHPSGSFLTSFLNFNWQLIMWSYIFQSFGRLE
jgi:hypothetical protein